MCVIKKHTKRTPFTSSLCCTALLHCGYSFILTCLCFMSNPTWPSHTIRKKLQQLFFFFFWFICPSYVCVTDCFIAGMFLYYAAKPGFFFHNQVDCAKWIFQFAFSMSAGKYWQTAGHASEDGLQGTTRLKRILNSNGAT